MIKRYPLVILAYFSATFCFFVAIYFVHDSDVVSSWIQTPATVSGHSVRQYGKNDNSIAMGYRGKYEYLSVYVNNVNYTYRVDGKNYHGIAPYNKDPKLQEGMVINVIYNPENYTQSRLSSETPWHLVLMWLVFSAIFYFSGHWWFHYQQRNH